MSKSLQTLSTNQRLGRWSALVSACRNSGQSVRLWCGENGVNEKTYYYWQRKVFQAVTQEEPQFAEVRHLRGRNAVAATIRLSAGEADIYSGADAETVAAICHALREC